MDKPPSPRKPPTKRLGQPCHHLPQRLSENPVRQAARTPAEEDTMRGKLAGILDSGLRDKMARYAESMVAIRPEIQVETIDGHYSTDTCAGFIGLAGREGRA